MRRLVGLVGMGLLVAACSGTPEAFGQVASSPGSVGTGSQRVLVAVRDIGSGEMLATPEIEPVATLRDSNGSPLGEYRGTFVETIPDVAGLYSFHVEIPEAANYQITLDSGEFGDLSPIGFAAVDNPLQVQVGDEAPRSETRTLDDAPLADLTTDPTPDESFYQMTVAATVDSGPSVLVFATPAWCTTQTCGPMLDQVQDTSAEYPGLNYVHVEIFENIHVTDREDLILVPAVLEWGLPSEPWLFVTDSTGTVVAAFEGAVADSELRAALESVSG
jgi:hypothetical protein